MKAGIFKALKSSTVRLTKTGIKFARHNSNWILAALTMIGLTGVTWSAIQGTIKAVKLCEEKKVRGKKEVIETTWKLYIPLIGFFILTTVSVVSNAKINAKKLATMTGLWAMSQADAKEFKKKVADMVGPKKEKSIETETEKEKVKALSPPDEKDIIKTGHGNQLFIDWLTGQWFRASPDYVELVQEQMNNSIRKEVDNTLFRKFMHEKFNFHPCGCDELFWDLCEMVTNGDQEIKLDCTHTEWMEVNGEKEIVCTLRCSPEATGF